MSPGSMSWSPRHADDPGEVMIATETDRGLFVGALVAAGYQVLAVNPMSTSRYRERHSTSGAKSDPGDAKVLADLARTDGHNHRPVAGDSDLGRGGQGAGPGASVDDLDPATPDSTSCARRCGSSIPAALEAFDELGSSDALAVLAIAPTPTLGRALSRSKIASALRRGGRQRRIDERAVEIQTALRVRAARGTRRSSRTRWAPPSPRWSRSIAEMTTQIGRLETELADHFEQHPDAKIIRSLPGLGMILGARVLGEFGDDPNRYADAKSRKNYAGTSPITRASGKHRVVLARYARNQRLADACYLWAFAALTASPGARAFYDQRRAAGDTHHRALRALANRLVGILHGCLRHHTLYDEHTAWGHRAPTSPLDTNHPWDV